MKKIILGIMVFGFVGLVCGSAYIFSGYQNLRHILNSAVKVGLEERNHIIWKYSFGLNTTKRFMSSH